MLRPFRKLWHQIHQVRFRSFEEDDEFDEFTFASVAFLQYWYHQTLETWVVPVQGCREPSMRFFFSCGFADPIPLRRGRRADELTGFLLLREHVWRFCPFGDRLGFSFCFGGTLEILSSAAEGWGNGIVDRKTPFLPGQIKRVDGFVA